MSQLDAVSVLGRLLKDRMLRMRFADDRKSVIHELGITESDTGFFHGLDLRQLDSQADSLIRKRAAEVARLIPSTWACLGSGHEIPSEFRQYVNEADWPEGHRRHLIDATQFCQFLHERSAAEYLASEHHWVAFQAGNQRFSFRLLKDICVSGEKRWGAQFCFRRNAVARFKSIHCGRWSKASLDL